MDLQINSSYGREEKNTGQTDGTRFGKIPGVGPKNVGEKARMLG